MSRQCIRLVMVGMIALSIVLATLACNEANMRVRDLPVWTCPTDTPHPTDIQLPTQVNPEATSTPRPTYTPYPTPTPYVLLTDFPLGKHVNIGALNGGIGLGIWVWMDEVEVTGPYQIGDETRWIAAWDVTVENASLTRPYEFYPMFQIYTLEVLDSSGRSLREGWGPSAYAAELVGADEMILTEEATRLEPHSQITVRVATFIPEPTLYRMAYVLDPLDTEDFTQMIENNSLGSNVGVWTNTYEYECTNGEITPGPGQPGLPIIPGELRLARWPLDSRGISRGFGCHALFTGVTSPDCPDEAPWFHNGIDFPAPSGSTYYNTLPGLSRIDYAGEDSGGPDCSSWAGSAAPHQGYGNFVRQTGLIGPHVVTVWGGHLSSLDVDSGNSQPAGGTLGQVGSTGCSTGAHLHFAVSVDFQFVDPLTLLP